MKPKGADRLEGLRAGVADLYHLAEAKGCDPEGPAHMKYYIIVNYGSISPTLRGPFLSDEARVRWAKKFRKKNPSLEDDLIRLTFPERGAPVVDSFYDYELGEEG